MCIIRSRSRSTGTVDLARLSLYAVHGVRPPLDLMGEEDPHSIGASTGVKCINWVAAVEMILSLLDGNLPVHVDLCTGTVVQ